MGSGFSFYSTSKNTASVLDRTWSMAIAGAFNSNCYIHKENHGNISSYPSAETKSGYYRTFCTLTYRTQVEGQGMT